MLDFRCKARRRCLFGVVVIAIMLCHSIPRNVVSGFCATRRNPHAWRRIKRIFPARGSSSMLCAEASLRVHSDPWGRSQSIRFQRATPLTTTSLCMRLPPNNARRVSLSKQTYRRFSTRRKTNHDDSLASFALWSSAVATPIVDDDTRWICQVKALSKQPSQPKQTGTAMGFYCFSPQTPNEPHWSGSAHFALDRSLFEAYYSAIYASLDYLVKQQHQSQSNDQQHLSPRLTIQCDHDMVVHQLNGQLEIQRESLRLLYVQIMKLKDEHFDELRFECIPSRLNKEAANLALQARENHKKQDLLLDMSDPMETIVSTSTVKVGASSLPKESPTRANESNTNAKDAATKEEHPADGSEESVVENKSPNAVSSSKPKSASQLEHEELDAFAGIFDDLSEDESEAKETDPDEMTSNKEEDDIDNDLDSFIMGAMEGLTGEERNTSMTANNALDAVPGMNPDHIYVLEFDGGTRANPNGVAGAGMVLYDAGRDGTNKTEIFAGWDFLGESQATNNQAEYSGLIAGLEQALARGVRKIEVMGDSQLIIKQLNGEYRVKAEKLKPLYNKATDLLQQFDSYKLYHIYRHLNSRADSLANLAMDNEESGSSG